MPLLDVGDLGEDFACDTQLGPMRSFQDHVRGRYAVFFSYPRDFTPVCSSEMQELLRLRPEFERRDVRVVGLSTDTVEEHRRFLGDMERVAGAGARVWFPVVSDVSGSAARRWGMLRRSLNTQQPNAPNAQPEASRALYVVGPDFRVEYVAVNPPNTGRNFAEVLRVLDSLQLQASQADVGTPASWRPGDRVVVLPSWPGLSGAGVGSGEPSPTSAAAEPPVARTESSVEVVETVTSYLSFASIKPLFSASSAGSEAKRTRSDE